LSAWHQSAGSYGERDSYRQISLERERAGERERGERGEIRKGKEGDNGIGEGGGEEVGIKPWVLGLVSCEQYGFLGGLSRVLFAK
jgi:hypothetical protein